MFQASRMSSREKNASFARQLVIYINLNIFLIFILTWTADK